MTSRKKPSTKKRVTKETLALLLTAIAETWSTDPTQPGLVLSHLKTGKYYGSIVRYNQSYGNSKNVVVQATCDTVGEVLRSLAHSLLAKRDAIDALREAVK